MSSVWKSWKSMRTHNLVKMQKLIVMKMIQICWRMLFGFQSNQECRQLIYCSQCRVNWGSYFEEFDWRNKCLNCDSWQGRGFGTRVLASGCLIFSVFHLQVYTFWFIDSHRTSFGWARTSIVVVFASQWLQIVYQEKESHKYFLSFSLLNALCALRWLHFICAVTWSEAKNDDTSHLIFI